MSKERAVELNSLRRCIQNHGHDVLDPMIDGCCRHNSLVRSSVGDEVVRDMVHLM